MEVARRRGRRRKKLLDDLKDRRGYCHFGSNEFLTFGAWLCMVLKLGRFGQQIRNTWKDLKCGAGEGWRRSVGPIV